MLMGVFSVRAPEESAKQFKYFQPSGPGFVIGPGGGFEPLEYRLSLLAFPQTSDELPAHAIEQSVSASLTAVAGNA